MTIYRLPGFLQRPAGEHPHSAVEVTGPGTSHLLNTHKIIKDEALTYGVTPDRGGHDGGRPGWETYFQGPADSQEYAQGCRMAAAESQAQPV